MKGEEKAACCSPSPTLLLDIVVLALCSQPGRCLGICLQFFRQLEKSPVTAGEAEKCGNPPRSVSCAPYPNNVHVEQAESQECI